MKLQHNISLKPYHNFACDEKTQFFTTIKRQDEIINVANWSKENKKPFLILGAGTNVLFTQNFEGLIAKMEIVGIKKLEELATEVFLEVGAGENWHHFVMYCIQKGWGGIENLSLIPGTVGASPIQNIGAYGVEVANCIHSVNAYDTQSNTWINFNKAACLFDYRTSLFKQTNNRYIIHTVTFKLQKQASIKTDYGVIREVLHDKNIKHPSISDISNAIIQIRSQKLPNPKLLPNAGSFFKNPCITKLQYEILKAKFPELIAHPISDESYKVAAGWLIAACDWKGVTHGQVGCYENQALIIINYGTNSGNEIFVFSEAIKKLIHEKFGITLETEVNVL